MTLNKTIITLTITLMTCIIIIIGFSIEKTTLTNNIKIPTEENGGIPVNIQDYNGKLVSLFLTQEAQITTPTSEILENTNNITVNNATGCLVGNAIDIYDNNNYFQGIIINIIGNNIIFTPKIDTNYGQDTEIKCGAWNMNVNGEVNEQEFYIKPPKNTEWDIESIGMQFIDNADWDISTFGSRSSLTNGFVLTSANRELFLIYNNGGFSLRGGVLTPFTKAPSGKYGFVVDLEFEKKYGSVLKLNGKYEEKIITKIRDDFSSQEEIAIVIRGHYKNDFQ
jgi:hypothetical protein